MRDVQRRRFFLKPIKQIKYALFDAVLWDKWFFSSHAYVTLSQAASDSFFTSVSGTTVKNSKITITIYYSWNKARAFNSMDCEVFAVTLYYLFPSKIPTIRMENGEILLQ